MTTTIPVEIVLTAGHRPVDLNNVFVSDADAPGLVREAELAGYPRTACAWIKGLYALVRRHRVDQVVMVTEGDCSQTHAMMETLRDEGIVLVPFAYPYDRDRERLRHELEKLLRHFGVTWQAAENMRRELVPLRRKVAELDAMTWQQGTVTGGENHLYQVSCSDFQGDPRLFAVRVEALLAAARERPAQQWRLRVGYVGVPPVYTDLYSFLEERQVLVAYNEVQRQFSMADSLDCDLLEQYARYTYPYDVFGRLADITREVKRRRLDGVIHYVQAFCFRQIQDQLIRRRVPCPVLTLEGDSPGPLEARNRLRLEAFLETLDSRPEATG